MWMLVPNPIINWIIWICISFIVIVIIVVIYFIQEWLRSDTIIIVNKDGTLNIKSRIIKRDERIAGKIETGKHTYLLEPEGVMNVKTFPQWKKVYCFDEGIPTPRKVCYRKDFWFSTETVTKILNDTRIKMMTKEPLDPGIKLFIIIGALCGIVGMITSGINLLISLGILKK